MSLTRIISAVTVSCALIAGTAFAGGHSGNPAVKARKAHMQLYQHNIGTLGGMARGNTEYNADAATAAARNLATLATLDQSGYWPPGTDSDTLGDETAALPAIWEKFPAILENAQALASSSAALAETAGNGLEALQAGIGPVGGACGACHKAYQKPRG